MRRRLPFPPQATLLGLALGLLGFGVPMLTFAWVTIGIIACANHGGWSALSGVTRQAWVFPETPDYFTRVENGVAGICVLIALIPTAMCVNWTTRIWRRLVVEKYKWMTNEQVDDFLKRDPGW